MALDIGEVRTGIAISDPGEMIASPLSVLPTREVIEVSFNFKRLLEDWEPELLLCGIPYTLKGEEGPQAKNIRAYADKLTQNTGLPIEFTDERLSSTQAKRSLREKGMNEREMRGKIDMIAAGLFLQAWLDARPSITKGEV